MSQMYKRNAVIMVIAIIFLAPGMYIFPFLMFNGTGGGFSSGGENARSVSLEDYVIQGAGFFLDSYANTMAYMQKVELSGQQGMNTEEIKMLLGKALVSMTNAHATYTTLKQLADAAPYNPVVIDGLLAFDYDGFKTANGMLAEPFKRAEKYLSKGDIRSIYGENIKDTAIIMEYLIQLKAEADAGKLPSIPVTWKLNHQFSQTLLFGQYVAEIFDSVLKDIN